MKVVGQEEDAGKTSKRMNSLYKMRNSLKDWTPNSEPITKVYRL